MTADDVNAAVIRLRAGSFYAVEPGAGGEPGSGAAREPVFYERTLAGYCSAVAHAVFLSCGGITQAVTWTYGRQTTLLREFRDGAETPRSAAGQLPPPYRTAIVPGPGASLRPGAPRGRITEISRHKMARTRREGDTP